MIKEDRDDLRNQIFAVIDDADIVPETKTVLTELVNTFIAALARQCKRNTEVDVSAIKSRAYTLWSYLINEGVFNQTVWWIEDEDFAWSVTLYTDEKNPNILSDLHNTLIMEPVDALDYLRGDTDEPDIGEYTPISASAAKSALHDKLVEVINVIAGGCVTCQAGPWPFDPDLPDDQNGCIYIVTDANGEAVRYNVGDDKTDNTTVEDPNLRYIDDIGTVPVAIVHPNINGWNPSIANMSTAPFIQFVNMLCVKRLNDSPTPNKCHPWVPMSNIMLIEDDHGSLELASCSDAAQTLVHPMGLPRLSRATKQRSAMYNLVSDLKNFKLKAEKFATCWNQLCDFARHTPSNELHIEKNSAESKVTLAIEDATKCYLRLTFHVTHVGHMTLPVMYETLDVPDLLDKWNPDEPPYPNQQQRAASLGTWCNIEVNPCKGDEIDVLLQSAFDDMTLKYTKVQSMEQLILGLNLVDEPNQVYFQVPTSYYTALDLMFNLIRESHELNEAAVIFIQSLKVLDI